ncbi:hypothetical protein HG530_011313 [Fusarium avenaceum]|nr:hypothetical protein HG530_011313 [Fusarium avenaceum]
MSVPNTRPGHMLPATPKALTLRTALPETSPALSMKREALKVAASGPQFSTSRLDAHIGSMKISPWGTAMGSESGVSNSPDCTRRSRNCHFKHPASNKNFIQIGHIPDPIRGILAGTLVQRNDVLCVAKLLLVQGLWIILKDSFDSILFKTKETRSNVDEHLGKTCIANMAREDSIHARMTHGDAGKGDVDSENRCSGRCDETVDVPSAVDG